MKISVFQLLSLLCIMAIATHAQEVQPPLLNIGDPAPPLRVREWVKGTPIQRFEKGRVYVLEFWATWCGPCIAAMPHLSALAAEYKDKVTFIGIDIYEKKTTSIEKVKAFVDSIGHRMDYNVAIEDSNFMESDWFDASGVRGIPTSFVVNAQGRLAWIGHPKDLDSILPKIVNNTWDIKDALSKRNLNKRLKELDDSLIYELVRFRANPNKPGDLGKPDSALLFIAEVIRNEPRLKYAPFIAFNTFSLLLKTNQHKAAYEYGKEVLVTPSYDEPAAGAIIDVIDELSNKFNLLPEIYRLGAQAYQVRINQIPYPELVNIPRFYHQMAAWYWRANDKSKAVDAELKAIEALKIKKNVLAKDKAAYESQLEKYKRM